MNFELDKVTSIRLLVPTHVALQCLVGEEVYLSRNEIYQVVGSVPDNNHFPTYSWLELRRKES